MNGLIEEIEEVIEEFSEGGVGDAGRVACVQAVEHYDMVHCGSLLSRAKAAGHKDVVSLLEETLAEEKKADTLLNQLVNKEINPQAFKAAA